MSTIVIIVGINIVLLVFIIGIYNGLVAAKNRFKNAFSQIDVQLKRRYDLIPNLVETAKGYMEHEKETLQGVIEARNSAMMAAKVAGSDPSNPEAMKALGSAESLLGSALGKLSVVMEAYPDLKANTTMEKLMEELTSTENRVAFARQAFNDSVMGYNTQREKFPANIVAGLFQFGEANQLQIEFPDGSREAPKISF